jgi:hypothetical protein
MHASYREDRPATADADPDAMLRMRIAIADAASVAEGVTLGAAVEVGRAFAAVRRPAAAATVDKVMKANATAAASRNGALSYEGDGAGARASLRWCPGRHGRLSTAAATRKVRSEQGSGGRVAALSAATCEELG